MRDDCCLTIDSPAFANYMEQWTTWKTMRIDDKPRAISWFNKHKAHQEGVTIGLKGIVVAVFKSPEDLTEFLLRWS